MLRFLISFYMPATPEGVEVFDFILYANMIYLMTIIFISLLVVCVDILYDFILSCVTVKTINIHILQCSY